MTLKHVSEYMTQMYGNHDGYSVGVWTRADKSIPSNGDDSPRECAVILADGTVTKSRYLTPYPGTARWEVESPGNDVVFWTDLP